jgi:hypothetical protein
MGNQALRIMRYELESGVVFVSVSTINCSVGLFDARIDTIFAIEEASTAITASFTIHSDVAVNMT